MARRNVDLVISAKDEAKKVLDQITAALDDFTNASKGVDGSANKTESSLGQLGAAISNLQKNLGGLDIAGKLEKELRSAEGELTRLEKALDGTKQDAAALEAQLAETGAAVQKFGSKQAGATKALENQRSAIKQTKQDQKELAASYNQASAAQDKFAARQAKLPGLIERQSAALDKAKAKYADLADRISATAAPSRTLQTSFDAAAASVDRQSGKLNKLTTEYGEIGGQVRAAGSAMAIFAGQSERAAGTVARQEKVLGQIKDNLTAVSAQSAALGREQGKLQSKVAGATKTIQSQQQAIDKAEDNYVELAQAAGKADAALGSLSGQSFGKLTSALQDQKRSTLEAKREYINLSKEATTLATAIGKVGVPTREMAEAFARTKTAGASAKQEYIQQREALELMGRAYRDTGQDIESINGTQARFQAILTRTTAALGRNAQEARENQAALSRIYTESTKAAGAMTRYESAAGRAAAANDKGAASGGRLADAYRQFYGDNRKSLGLLQRIRGEVLSLVAAYGGLFAVIQTLKGTVDAYQQLEAAQARLTVATGGDTALAAQELDFLRRSADRLGIQFGVLATEYSKFSIATQNTRLEGEATRKIFTAVAESARVNKNSTEEMAGVFTALTQIVSKGAVQMEELRQQLGDRLPGAIRLMADGLGVGTAELIKMMEQGEVTSDALLPFAEELQKRFGPGLADALSSTSASLGKLSNEAFEALLRFGEAGFLDAFTDMVDTLVVTLKSADFQDFAARVSSALAGVVRTVSFAIENFQFFFTVLAGFAGLKFTPIVIAIANGMRDVGRASIDAAKGVSLTGNAAAGASGKMTILAGAVNRVRVALLTLLSTTGLGLLVAAIGAGIALWATSGTSATEAMIEHERIVDQVKNTYDAAGRNVEKFGEKIIKSLKLTDVRRNLRELEDSFKDAVKTFNDIEDGQGGVSIFAKLGLGSGASKEFVAEIDKIVGAVNRGELEMSDLADAIDDTAEKFNDGNEANRRYAEGLLTAAKDIENKAAAVRRLNLIIQAMTGSVEEQEAALAELNGTLKESAAGMETASETAAKFDAALKEIQSSIPGIGRELDYLEESKALENMLATAIDLATNMTDVEKAMKAAAGAQTALDNDFVGGSLVDRIIGVESGGDPNAKNPKSSATGLGQFIESTWLRMFKQYFPGAATGMSNAAILELRKDAGISRQMVQFYLQENAKHLRSAGVAINDANLYLSHFLGPGGAASLIGSAPGTPTSQSLGAGQINANRSILEGKTREEVIAWAQRKVGISETELSVQESVVDARQKQIEATKKAAEEAAKLAATEQAATDGRLADGTFALSQQELINQGKERQAAIEEAIRAAKEADPNISTAELEQIKQQTAALFDLEKAKENSVTASEAAKKSEEEVNNLLSQRAALVQQIELAKGQGDLEQEENLKLKIGEINAELLAAIENSQKLWSAVGGSEADAAIQKLQTAKLETQNFGTEAKNAYLQWDRVGDLFLNGLASAFDTFAQSVAEGQSVGEAARDAFLKFASDFLIQIAQMIIKQAIFNALRAAFGGTSFGSLIGIGTAHTGGLIGSSRAGSGNSTRQVSPAMFAGAARYHQGGMIGLRPGEVPIIAEQGEEMLTRDDPRHMLNGGGAAAPAQPKGGTTIINTFDPEEVLSRALSSPMGQEVLVNTIRGSRTEIKAALG